LSTQRRVLIVDDEPRILEGIKRSVRGAFELHTAVGAGVGMEMLRSSGPYAVVISDLRMPGTDGTAFLAAVRRAAPDTVRILLTGFGDVDAAMTAVNENRVFRFFRKPCPASTLISAVMAGIDQYELVIAERELLEETLQGCLHALADVLAMTSPLAFARAVRVKECVSSFAVRYGIPNRWQYEVAATLSQLGAASLPKEVAEKLYFGRPLTAEERAMVAKTPGTSAALIAHVPRLEAVREILTNLDRDCVPTTDGTGNQTIDDVPLGSRILRIAFDFDVLVTQGKSVPQALSVLLERGVAYDSDVLMDFSQWQGETLNIVRTRDLSLAQLQVGMTLAADVVTMHGVLLIARGQQVTLRVMSLINEYWINQPVREPVRVYLESASTEPAAPANVMAGATAP
jgi:response regulator RpfG family c-di-GMP phosphodiesterase